MSERIGELTAAVALALVVVAVTALAPTLVAARPAFEIPVHYAATGGETLAEPTGEEWSEAPPVTVPMTSAASGLPNADETTVERVSVAAARTNDRLYLRLSWADATRDTSTNDTRAFADAVAVQMPVNTTARPPIAMGSTRNQVNVWYWSASTGSEELLAGGPGTTTRFDSAAVSVERTYEDGRWQVVYARTLPSDRPNRTAIPRDRDLDVAFAVWNGSNMERSGRKAASDWYYLALGPDTGGPPYETILWAVAGLGIVFTTLVTIEGVRRTRGE